MAKNPTFNEKAAENFVIGQVTQQFKSYGHFGRFRDRLLTGIDSQPHHHSHIRDKVEDATRYFLSIQKWHPQMDKNLLREQLKNFLSKNHSVKSAIQKSVKEIMVKEKVNDKVFAVIDMLVRDCLLYCCGEIPEAPTPGTIDPSNFINQPMNVASFAQFYASCPPPAIAFPAPPGQPYFFYPAPGTNMMNWAPSSSYDNQDQRQDTSSYSNNYNNANYDSSRYETERKIETSNLDVNSYKSEQTAGQDSRQRQDEKQPTYGRSYVHPSRAKFDDRRRTSYYYEDYDKRRKYDRYDRERSHRKMQDWRYRK